MRKGQSVRTGLIYCDALDPQIYRQDAFDFLVSAEAVLIRA